MSAWMASDKHIASVVCSVIKEELRQGVADCIKKANLLSINYRYNEDEPFEPCDLTQAITLTNKDKVKLCYSLDYQSCEHPEWETCTARGWLKEIVFSLAFDLCPENAKWSL